MITEDIEILLSNDLKSYESNDISDEILHGIDDILISKKYDISHDAFLIYKKFTPMKQEAPDGMKMELFNAMNNYKKELYSQSKFVDALLIARFLIVKSQLAPIFYYDISEILIQLNQDKLAIEFIRLYEKKETNKPLGFLTIANFYNISLCDYKTAIKYYEKYLKIDETKAAIYTIVGSLYTKEYGDYSLKDQIYYYERAYRLKPDNRLILFSLALAYEKYGDKGKANNYYSKLIQNNPTDADFYNYGAFLISCGDLKKGHEYLTHRFKIENNINLKYPISDDISKKWDLKSDISQKTLLVHYEQGFGDTFMYCRFVPMLKKYAKKIIFVVQDSLFELLKISHQISDGIEIVSDTVDISTINYDYDMALLDVPCVLEIDAGDIPYRSGYLRVPDEFVEKYKDKYIKPSKNLKVGIAYRGSQNSNYNDRNVDLSRFEPLFNIDNIDFYSFEMVDKKFDKVTNLGNTFNSFTDTACAIKCMDLIISTDNVILNLAGALGVKTYGLFNKYANFRWFNLEGDNVGWYESVKPFQVKDKDCWTPVFGQLYNILAK